MILMNNTFVYTCTYLCPAQQALVEAFKAFKLLPDYPAIQALQTFKVDGLWVITITYN